MAVGDGWSESGGGRADGAREWRLARDGSFAEIRREADGGYRWWVEDDVVEAVGTAGSLAEAIARAETALGMRGAGGRRG